MDQKIFWIVGIIIIILGIGLAITMISSDKQDTDDRENELAMSPFVVFEGTVVSLALEPGNYSNGSQVQTVPNDTAVIKIDKIITTGGSNFNWTNMGIKEGREISLSFMYTARPAKIIRSEGETFQKNRTISHSVVPTNITYDKGYFVFRIDGDSDRDTTLPGLKVGSKFKAKVWNTYEFKIGEYELLN